MVGSEGGNGVVGSEKSEGMVGSEGREGVVAYSMKYKTTTMMLLLSLSLSSLISLHCVLAKSPTATWPSSLIGLFVALTQNIISCCHALLSLQPVKQSDADVLNRLVICKADVLGFPLQLSTSIATLPVLPHGFNFPSIACINAVIPVNGITWDLNHHSHHTLPWYASCLVLLSL